MSAFRIITPLLRRVIIFLCLFIGISGVIGPIIIDSTILFRDGFWIYGGLGKGLLFGFIAFALLVRRNTSPVVMEPWQTMQLAWLCGSGLALAIAWFCINDLLAGNRDPFTLAGAHAGLIAGVGLCAIGCLGITNMQRVWQSYKRETIYAIGLAALFYIFLDIVYALWMPLASIVMFSVQGLLGFTGLEVTIVQPHTLLFDKFGITIAEFCSGIESIALFTSLYAIVGLLDWHRIHKKRYFLLFPIALFILCILNILRVFGLILAGYYINPEIAFSLFHTYAGMAFFIIYSSVFWAIAYKHIIRRPPPHEDSSDH